MSFWCQRLEYSLESPLIIVEPCHHKAPLITHESYYKCCRCSVLWLTALDRPTICETLDIRLVVKSEEVRMIVKPILKADAVPQPPTVFFHFFKAFLSISCLYFSVCHPFVILYFSFSYPFFLPSFSPHALCL